MGPIPPPEYTGQQGSEAPNHGLPRFEHASFDAAYPFAIVNLEDDKCLFLQKPKHLIHLFPAIQNHSGIPIAVIRYEIKNKTNGTLTVAVAGSLDNFIGMDGSGQNSIVLTGV